MLFTNSNMILLVITAFLSQVLGEPVPSIKGQLSNIAYHPWLVSIQKNGIHYCGGSIISDIIILTAGHCIPKDPLNLYTVRVGSSEINSGGSCHNVEAAKRHEHYQQIDRMHHKDVGLIRVSPSITFDSSGRNVAKIQLAETWDVVTAGTSASVAGWGKVKRSSGPAPKVRKTFMRIVDGQDCSISRGDGAGTLMSLTNHICAAPVEYGSDVCLGDSGSPLVANYIQIGIVVMGNCGSPIHAESIYIDVARYRDWIDENSAQMEFTNYT